MIIPTKGFCRCGGASATPARSCNNVVVNIPPQLADAATYSQLEQISLGNAPSWDSPDIFTNGDFLSIIFVLLPNITVTVRNLSPSIPAIGVLVHAYTSAFGIGMPQTYLSTQRVNIPPNTPVTLSFALTQAVLSSGPFIGFYVVLEHAHDLKIINNYGAQVVSAHNTAISGSSYAVSIPLCNNFAGPRTIGFSVMPTAINASFSPNSYTFAANEQIVGTLNVTVPANITGSLASPNLQEVTVVGTVQGTGQLVGGATEAVLVDA